MLACTHPAFEGPVILFQDVIKILHRSMSTLLFQNTAGFELNNGGWIRGCLSVLMTRGAESSSRPRLWSESARPPLHRA